MPGYRRCAARCGVETGIPDALAELIYTELSERGLEHEPVGMDVPDTTTLLALQRKGIDVADSQPIMLEARKLKSADEIALLDHAAAIVDAAYEEIYRILRPGITENEVVAAAMKAAVRPRLGARRGDQRDLGRPLHPASAHLRRPPAAAGRPGFFDIIHSFMGYRTCYYRTFNVGYATPSQIDAYKQCREWLDAAIELVRPGMTTDKIAAVWPSAQEIGMADERAAFGLQFGHGLGVGLYESPMISRLHSFDSPGRARGRDGVRARDVLPGDRRPLGGADRGGGRGHAHRPAGADAVPGRGAARDRKVYVRGADLLEGRVEYADA